jgi:hypothetical protein
MVDSWQVFKADEPPGTDAQDAVDERDPLALTYVGRITKPEDAYTYWKPDVMQVGERFGAGQFVLFADDQITEWDEDAATAGDRNPIFLDVVAQTTYKRREPAEIRP